MQQLLLSALACAFLIVSGCGGGGSGSSTTETDQNENSDDSGGAQQPVNPNPNHNGSGLPDHIPQLERVELYNTYLVFTDDPNTESKKYVENLNQGLDKRPGEMMVYLPPVPDAYRGILFFDGSSGTPRYQAGHVAESLQFVCIELGWFWQDRLEPGKENYDANYKISELMAELADYTGYSEIAHIPWAFCPRQVGNRSIGYHVTEAYPELADRVVAFGYGFGDGHQNKFQAQTQVGFPTSYAFEVRHRFADRVNDQGQTTFSLAGSYKSHARREGSLHAIAGEQGFSRHYNNSKPELGLMLVARAVYHRVINAQREANGSTNLIELNPSDGWLGSLAMPSHEPGTREFTYTDWTEIAPYEGFTGSTDYSSWLIDEEFAVAWRGYMTPDPLIEITTPTNSFGKAQNYFGKAGLLDAGPVTITWQPFEPIGSTQFAHLSSPDTDRQARITRVDIYKGGDHLGGSAGSSGEITVDFAPGVHLLVAIATLDDGSQTSSWPIGFGVRGDWYAHTQELFENN